ncbi:hypothetical protein [Methyloglobulus sp.]|uniref:hypothetical protein n=1 Tax=Methyloglobulus sp. TaxID=2518622 RepID=UPI003989027A
MSGRDAGQGMLPIRANLTPIVRCIYVGASPSTARDGGAATVPYGWQHFPHPCGSSAAAGREPALCGCPKASPIERYNF